MVGGSRQTQKFARPPFSISGVGKQLLRQGCDARGFKPLPIEIIARRRVAPTFEPQKGERKNAPGIPVQCYGCFRSSRVGVLRVFSTSGLRRLFELACRLIEERSG
jgi:hypothetical protein